MQDGWLHIRITAMDIVYIKNLRVETVIGIFDWERKIKQTVSLDIEMATDITPAAASDCIDNTLDYQSISVRIIEFVKESSFQLIEALAEAISNILLTEFHVSWLKLRVGKPGAIPDAEDVGVIIERGKQLS